MKFCFLTTFFPPQHFGGDAIAVTNLASALAAEGHEVDVVHCADSFELLRGPVSPSQVSLHPEVRVHTLRSPFGALSPFLTYTTGQPWLKQKSLEEILSRDFDVVHWHNLSLVGGPGALRLGKGVRVYTFHDYWPICPTHILFKFNEEACRERECLKCTLRHRRVPQIWRAGAWTEQSLKSHIDLFLSPSRFVQEQYRRSALAIESTVLPHFIRPQPRQEPEHGSEPYYLFAGRLEKAKGVQKILPFFCKPGRRLLIAGAGNCEQELRAMASGNSSIEFLGRVPYDRLAKLYAGALATLVPSLCFETFGLTILESLAQATPVITSRYGALPEVVAATGGGVTYANSDELESILTRFDTNPALRRRLGETGYASLGGYSPQRHLDRYLSLIEAARSTKSRAFAAR